MKKKINFVPNITITHTFKAGDFVKVHRKKGAYTSEAIYYGYIISITETDNDALATVFYIDLEYHSKPVKIIPITANQSSDWELLPLAEEEVPFIGLDSILSKLSSEITQKELELETFKHALKTVKEYYEKALKANASK